MAALLAMTVVESETKKYVNNEESGVETVLWYKSSLQKGWGGNFVHFCVFILEEIISSDLMDYDQ